MAHAITETETVIKRILPYLTRRGYDPVTDFNYETGTKLATRYAQGYIDILVRNVSGHPAFLVEAKRSSRRLTADDTEQALEYGRSQKVPFVVVTNGTDVHCFNVKTGSAIRWDDKLENKVPSKEQLPKVLRTLRANPDASNISLSDDPTLPFRPGIPLKQLNALFARCHNAIRKIEKNEEHAFSDFSKLLFLKLLEEKADVEGKAAKLPYSYLFHQLAEKPDREADQVKAAILSMVRDIKANTTYGDVLGDPIDLKQPKTFLYIVRQLSAVSFEDSGLDYKGAAFEYFVRATLKGKKLGQYFTPRPLVELMAVIVGKEAIVNAAIANEPTKVLDPACGTGGFLVFMLKQALRQLRQRRDAKVINQSLYASAAKRLKAEIFYGSDANDGVAASAKMNMIIAGDGHTNIRPEDSLRQDAATWNVEHPDCDFILTNPPFGTSESESLPPNELGQFPIRASKGQNLFLQKMILCTKAGGLICTVIDEGVLNTDTAKELRGFVLSTCKVMLIIQLPDVTFKPNKINVRSSVLLLRRREISDPAYEDKYQITFCRLESLGYNGSGDNLRGFDTDRLLNDFSNKVQVPGKARKGANWSAFDVPSEKIASDPGFRFDLKYWDPSIRTRMKKLERSKAPSISSLNLIETRRGKSPPSDVYVGEQDGHALVVKAGSNISQYGILIDSEADYIEKSVFDDMPDFCKLKKGDVLLSSTGDGTLGKACVYDRSTPAIADGHVTIIRVDKATMNPYFLADYLRCGFGSAQVARLYTGSTGLIELAPERVNEILVPKMALPVQMKASTGVRSAEEAYRGGIERAGAALQDARVKFEAFGGKKALQKVGKKSNAKQMGTKKGSTTKRAKIGAK